MGGGGRGWGVIANVTYVDDCFHMTVCVCYLCGFMYVCPSAVCFNFRSPVSYPVLVCFNVYFSLPSFESYSLFLHVKLCCFL